MSVQDFEDEGAVSGRGRFEEPTTDEGWEALARPMGWHPFEGDNGDAFRGPPAQWKDAEAFVRHAWANTPVLRAQNHKLLNQVERLTRDNGELKSTVSRLGVEIEEVKAGSTELLMLARKARDAGRREALQEIEDRERQAVEEGDPAKFEAARAQAQRLANEWKVEDAEVRPQTPAPKDPVVPPPQPINPEIEAFVQDNPWFNDPEIGPVFIAMHQKTVRAQPRLAISRQLEQTKRDFMGRFPDYFDEEPGAVQPAEGEELDYEEPAPAPAPRPRPPAQRVLAPKQAGGPRDPGGSPRGRGVWDQITDPQERADAKAAFAKASKSQPELTAEEYVAIMIDPKADILEIQRKQRQRAAGGNR